MYTYLLLALILIVVILLFYMYFGNSDKRKRDKVKKHYQSSIGEFDDDAIEALNQLEDIDEPNAEDNFLHGAILEYNLLQGDLDRGNKEIIGTIIDDYTETVQRIQIGARDENNNDDFMIYRIENFNDRMYDDENTYLRRILDDNQDGILAAFDDVITKIPEIRKQNLEERKQDAIKNAGTKEEAAENFLDASTKFTSDPQNVHDPKVNEDLRDILRRLRKSANISPGDSIKEARKYISENYTSNIDRIKANKALQVLDTISKRNTISTFNDTEDNIFAATWGRTSHPRNKDNAELMRGAIVDALADCMEDNGTVCINGRTARVLNSLTLLDYDPAMSGAKTYEAYKNQIYQETKDIISDEVQKAKNSPDDKLRAVGESFEGKNVEIDEQTERIFIETVKNEISLNIDHYDTKLTEKERSQLKEECCAAISF